MDVAKQAYRTMVSYEVTIKILLQYEHDRDRISGIFNCERELYQQAGPCWKPTCRPTTLLWNPGEDGKCDQDTIQIVLNFLW